MRKELWVYVNLKEVIGDEVDSSSLTFDWDYVSSIQSVVGGLQVLQLEEQSPECGQTGNGKLSCNVSI